MARIVKWQDPCGNTLEIGIDGEAVVLKIKGLGYSIQTFNMSDSDWLSLCDEGHSLFAQIKKQSQIAEQLQIAHPPCPDSGVAVATSDF